MLMKICDSNSLGQFSNIGRNISDVIEDLLVTVHNIVAGIASISNSITNENLVEIKIHVPEVKHPIVVLRYELGTSSGCKKYSESNGGKKKIGPKSRQLIEKTLTENVNCDDSFVKGNFTSNLKQQTASESVNRLATSSRIQNDDGEQSEEEESAQMFESSREVGEEYLQNSSSADAKDNSSISMFSRDELYKIFSADSDFMRNFEKEKCNKNCNVEISNKLNDERNNFHSIINDSDEYIDITTYEQYVRAMRERNKNKSLQPCEIGNLAQKIDVAGENNSKDIEIVLQTAAYESVHTDKFASDKFMNVGNSEITIVEITDGRTAAEICSNLECTLPEKRFHCEFCGKSFQHLKDKIQHLKIHSGEKPYVCRYCRKTFHRQIEKNQHEKIHTDERPYICKFCGKGFVQIGSRNCHEKMHLAVERFPCSYCGKWFLTKRSKDVHEKLHSEDKQYPCSYCEKSFVTFSRKYQHERVHTREKSYLCSYCEKSFLSPSEKKRHEIIHTGEKPYPCLYCDKFFARVHDKNQHEKTHMNKKSYMCRFCDKPFSCLQNKNRHEKFHVGERPYLCMYCGKSFPLLRDKTRHEKIHSAERPYPCTYCGKCFISKSSQRRHEMIHTGDKPHACNYCDKKFFNIGDKTQHEMIHMGIRPYPCDFCQKSFTSMRCKKQHERLHKMREITPTPTEVINSI